MGIYWFDAVTVEFVRAGYKLPARDVALIKEVKYRLNFIVALEPTPIKHKGYSYRDLSPDEKSYIELKPMKFRRSNNTADLLCMLDPCQSWLQDDFKNLTLHPVGAILGHEITIFGQGTFQPEGKK